MARRKATRPATDTVSGPHADFQAGELEVRDANRNKTAKQGGGAIRATLIGNDTCSALGLTVRAYTPVLGLCRKLVETGCDPATPLAAYRANTLALHVRSIGEAGRLEINAHGTDFIARHERRAASPVRGSGRAGVRQRGGS